MSKETPSLTRFIEPTVILAIITAALYFWGYAYFAGFCEHLGVGFHGIEIHFRDYLIVRWDNVLSLSMGVIWFLTAIFFLLILSAPLMWLLKNPCSYVTKIIGKFSPKFESIRVRVIERWNSTPDPEFTAAEKFGYQLGRYVYIIICVIGVALFFANSSIKKGQKAAQYALENKLEVIIRDTNNKPIDGNFIYLRDFGGALLVGEQSEDGETTTGIRILKAGSYHSYTIAKDVKKDSEPVPEQLPSKTVEATVDVLPVAAAPEQVETIQ